MGFWPGVKSKRRWRGSGKLADENSKKGQRCEKNDTLDMMWSLVIDMYYTYMSLYAFGKETTCANVREVQVTSTNF